MRLRAFFERKGLVAMGFGLTILFLYKLAGNPTVNKFMQSLMYYNNNNEPICLPKNYLQKQKPTKKCQSYYGYSVKK